MEKLQEAELWQLGIYSLRSYAREIGVFAPTTKNKEQLIDNILKVQNGELLPQKTVKGRRPILLTEKHYKAIFSPSLTEDIKQNLIVSIYHITPKNINNLKKTMRKQFVTALNWGTCKDLEFLYMVLVVMCSHIKK